jgi:hypothetical protein
MKSGINWQRSILGLLGLFCLVIGLSFYFLGSDSSPQLRDGILVRVGLLLCVTWLALPQLETIKTRIPGYLLLVVLVLLVILAVRPKIFPILAGLLAVSLTLSWGLKWVSRITSTPRK